MSVERALALLGEHDLEAPRDVEAALELIAGREEDEAPVEISRYDLQLFLWYELPCKLLAPFEVKQAVAERLGRFLELAGDGAADYAEICTSEQTMGMLLAWEDEEPSAGEQLRAALEASGLEPPDTDALRWRKMMGFEEAPLRSRVAYELECWVEAEGLEYWARGFKRRQAAFVADFLHRPQAELDGRIPLDVIGEERLEHWARGGSDERRAIVDSVVTMLRASEEDEDRLGEGLMAPLVWLLQQAAAGIGLTQTGALNRALVRASVERFPAWWHIERWGPPHREDEVSPLCEVHDLARRMRLLRKTGSKLALTKRGEALLRDPVGLRDAVAPHLITAEGFASAVQELAVAVLLDGEGSVDRDEMQGRLHAAIVADGWNAAGESPDVHEVTAYAWGAIRLAEALELLVYEHEYDRATHSSRSELTLTPSGRELLRLGPALPGGRLSGRDGGRRTETCLEVRARRRLRSQGMELRGVRRRRKLADDGRQGTVVPELRRHGSSCLPAVGRCHPDPAGEEGERSLGCGRPLQQGAAALRASGNPGRGGSAREGRG